MPLSALVTGGLGAYLRASLLPYVLACALLGGVVIGGPWALRELLGPRRAARLARKLPLVGPLVVARTHATFARQLAAALRAGLDAFASLRLASRATADPDFIDRIDGAAARVKSGATLEEGLARSGLFSDELLLAVAGGEASGRLDDSLDQQARLTQDAAMHGSRSSCRCSRWWCCWRSTPSSAGACTPSTGASSSAARATSTR